MKAFRSEHSMARLFPSINTLAEAFGYKQWRAWQAAEIKGLFGVPDHLVIFWKESQRECPLYRTIACEMKLTHWRRALVQAYRYKAFAHYSIVVMDHAYAHRASRCTKEFEKANIGLASLSPDGSLQLLYRPRFELPYSEPMRRSLRGALVRDVFVEKSRIREFHHTIEWNVKSGKQKVIRK